MSLMLGLINTHGQAHVLSGLIIRIVDNAGRVRSQYTFNGLRRADIKVTNGAHVRFLLYRTGFLIGILLSRIMRQFILSRKTLGHGRLTAQRVYALGRR